MGSESQPSEMTEGDVNTQALGRLVADGIGHEITTREVLHTQRISCFGPGMPTVQHTGKREVEIVLDGHAVVFHFDCGTLARLEVRRRDN